MTVRELIALLQTFPEDAAVAACLDASLIITGSKVGNHLPFSGATAFTQESLSDTEADGRDTPAMALFLEVREPFVRQRPRHVVVLGT
jgi:hypothetical protein